MSYTYIPTLNISQPALQKFSTQALKLSTTSIKQLLIQQWGTPTLNDIQDIITNLPERVTSISTDIIPETLNLVVSNIASQIKQNHNSSNIRLEYENDFLICIELFNDALNTNPD
jgi:hypothetical protein